MVIERYSLMKKLMNKVAGFMKNEEGQGVVEYALIQRCIQRPGFSSHWSHQGCSRD
jgi:hypothetical protein